MDAYSKDFIAEYFRRAGRDAMSGDARFTLAQAVLGGEYAAARTRRDIDGGSTDMDDYMTAQLVADETLQAAIADMSEEEGNAVGEWIDAHWTEIGKTAVTLAAADRPGSA